MDNKKILDPIEKTDSCRFSLLSFRVFLLSAFIFLLFLILALINPGFAFFEYMVLILAASFVISNIAGFVLTIKSITSKESDSIYKTIGAVGNLLLFLVMLGMVGFVLVDLL